MFALDASPACIAAFAQLDELGLYVPPLCHPTRGGERFIFHAAALAKALTEAIGAHPYDPELRRELAGFSHVNPVFRCNRFEPGDAPFERHLDTPYYDAERNHISRQTLLLYLTGGRAAPALRFDDVTLEEIAPLTCVIFDQDRPHEGAPYGDGRKVFLRTELVGSPAEGLSRDPDIAPLFSRACYLNIESVFAPELARWADGLYQRVSEARWSGLVPTAPEEPEPFLHKTFREMSFVSNGCDYWFDAARSLEECAALAVLDHLNCHIDDVPFRAQVRSEIVHADARDAAWVPAFLREHAGDARPALPRLDPDVLVPPPEEDDGNCCSFHAEGDGVAFDPTRNAAIIAEFEARRSSLRETLAHAPIVALGQAIYLVPERFLIEDGHILILSNHDQRPLQFAGGYCWMGRPEPHHYIGRDGEAEVLNFVVPPIPVATKDGCHHLRLDYFRNDWVLAPRPHGREDIPKILLDPP